VLLVTGTPLAGWIAYRLNLPAGRKLFNRSVTPLTDVEKAVIGVPTAILLLGIPAFLILL
jgi:glucose-6-phosphate dehydrogenase assembly protein OpcA